MERWKHAESVQKEISPEYFKNVISNWKNFNQDLDQSIIKNYRQHLLKRIYKRAL
jgi:hypothetical protein